MSIPSSSDDVATIARSVPVSCRSIGADHLVDRGVPVGMGQHLPAFAEGLVEQFGHHLIVGDRWIPAVTRILSLRRQEVRFGSPSRSPLRGSVERDLHSSDPVTIAVLSRVPLRIDHASAGVVDVGDHVDVQLASGCGVYEGLVCRVVRPTLLNGRVAETLGDLQAALQEEGRKIRRKGAPHGIRIGLESPQDGFRVEDWNSPRIRRGEG